MRKTNKVNEVEVNYCNNMENNKFKGLAKFPNEYCVRLANVLCKNDEMVQEYLNKYYNPSYEYPYEVVNSLQDYKRDIKDRRTDVNQYEDNIKNCIYEENWEGLRLSLQDLFLDYLEEDHIEKIVKLIHKSVNEGDIMRWYFKDKKILAMTTFEVEYIKQI